MIKKILKLLMTLIVRLCLLPVFIIYKLQLYLIKSERFFSDMAQSLSLIPGILGEYTRREFYRFSLKKCSDNCCICFGTVITHPQAQIGDKVYIGMHCTIGTVLIEDDVLIGSNVDILSGKKQHGFNTVDEPISLQQRCFEQVTIGKGSWIGNSSVIMADVGEKSVVGAGSVVVKKIDSFSVAVGNPACIIRKRE